MKTPHELVSAWVDDHVAESVEFLQDLIRIRSVNPVFKDSEPIEEKRCQELLADALRDLGFTDFDMWEPDPVVLRERYLGRPGYTPERRFENRPNLVARLPGSGGGRSLFLTGHVDVVNADPEEEDWDHDPWAAVVEDGKVYGRGSADMKAGLAAMVQAVRSIQLAGFRLKGDVLFGSVVDEETGSMGMLSLVDRGYRADAGIMPEPTDLQLGLLCRGIIWGRITARGRSGHIEVSQPSAESGGAVDAIDYGKKILAVIDDINADWKSRPDKRHPLVPSPCQVNVSMVRAGQHPSSYAEECTITVDIQYLPAERDEYGLGGLVQREVEERINAIVAGDRWLQEHPIEFDWFVCSDCSEVEPDHPFARLCAERVARLGLDATFVGSEYHTDMSLLTNSGTPTVNFGPGAPHIAHRTNEHVSIEQYVAATKAIAHILIDWCGVDSA
jgi:acetylornithine deacetylase